MSTRPVESWAGRIAVVCHALGGDHALELVEGLSEPALANARGSLLRAAALSTAGRRARLSAIFGPDDDSGTAFRQLVDDSGGALREALVAAAPASWRRSLQGGGARVLGPSGPEGVVRFAARLIRETSR